MGGDHLGCDKISRVQRHVHVCVRKRHVLRRATAQRRLSRAQEQTQGNSSDEHAQHAQLPKYETHRERDPTDIPAQCRGDRTGADRTNDALLQGLV
eukprot:7376991-Prymnesium_polylepis.4